MRFYCAVYRLFSFLGYFVWLLVRLNLDSNSTFLFRQEFTLNHFDNTNRLHCFITMCNTVSASCLDVMRPLYCYSRLSAKSLWRQTHLCKLNSQLSRLWSSASCLRVSSRILSTSLWFFQIPSRKYGEVSSLNTLVYIANVLRIIDLRWIR